MSAVAVPTTESPASLRSPGMPKRWTVEQYLAMCETGIVRPEDRVELLQGEIIEKMGQDFPHIDGVTFLVEALRAVLGAGFHVRSQLPLRTEDSVLEPDVLVLRGTHRDYVGRYPKPEEVALVAEVANTTLKSDRLQKSGIYARAGFGEYWILNVADRQLEIHRNPLSSGIYGEVRVYRADESVQIEGRSLPVADLLP